MSKSPSSKTAALSIKLVDVDEHCIGTRWVVADIDLVARIVAIVAMGQSSHAARIIAQLSPAEPAVDEAALRLDAKQRLQIAGKTADQRTASRHRRDGLIFEIISWMAARQSAHGRVRIRDPHISSTTQGLDGLMLELDKAGTITQATIFEDKCSENPRKKFLEEVMPSFQTYHSGRRASELLTTAATLLAAEGFDGTKATQAAARTLDKNFRTYRGSLVITTDADSEKGRRALFKGYEGLSGIPADRRIAATFVTPDDLRLSFEQLADRAIAYISSLETGGP